MYKIFIKELGKCSLQHPKVSKLTTYYIIYFYYIYRQLYKVQEPMQ